MDAFIFITQLGNSLRKTIVDARTSVPAANVPIFEANIRSDLSLCDWYGKRVLDAKKRLDNSNDRTRRKFLRNYNSARSAYQEFIERTIWDYRQSANTADSDASIRVDGI